LSIREQVELYEATSGAAVALNGKPVIVLTFKGAKSGKIRKTPLMRIEHNGTYAVVASNAGAPTHPIWYRNIVANPLVELQARSSERFVSGKSLAKKRTSGGSGRTPPTRNSPLADCWPFNSTAVFRHLRRRGDRHGDVRQRECGGGCLARGLSRVVAEGHASSRANSSLRGSLCHPNPNDSDISKTKPAHNKALVLESFELVPRTQA
jgi:deazaflavin-dependent oxidoreductase (nitroreductase family)